MSENRADKFFQEKFREFRRDLTPIELKLWFKIRNNQLGVKFRRQYPILNRYILDFVCLEKKLVLELDGEEHTFTDSDKERDKFLELNGFKVVRFWNNQIVNELDSCIDYICEILKER